MEQRQAFSRARKFSAVIALVIASGLSACGGGEADSQASAEATQAVANAQAVEAATAKAAAVSWWRPRRFSRVSVDWVSPEQNAAVSGVVELALTGKNFTHVEIFNAGKSMGQARVSADRTRAVFKLDTASYAGGKLELTAHARNSEARSRFLANDDAGSLTLQVDNGALPRPPVPTPEPTTPEPSTPSAEIKLDWVKPAMRGELSGIVQLGLEGKGFLNVEVFHAGRRIATAELSEDYTQALAEIDTRQLPDGNVTLTAHAWNSPQGEPASLNTQAELTIAIKNAKPAPSPAPTPTPDPQPTPDPTPTPTTPSSSGCRKGAPGHVAPTCVKDALMGLGAGDLKAWAKELGRSVDLQEQWNDPPPDREDAASQWEFMENIFSVQSRVVEAKWPGKLSFAQPMWAGGRKGSESSDWEPFVGEGPGTCASGKSDKYMRNVLTALKQATGGDAYIRLGWEFNANWYPNQSATRGASSYSGDYKADWKKCWIRWYDIAKSISPNFKLVWNPIWSNRGTCAKPEYDIRDYWPGAEFVDAAGPDQYNVNCNGRRADPDEKGPNGEPRGINTWVDFVISQGVPFAVPEWGIDTGEWGMGDDGQFIADMYAAFARAHASPSGLAYQSYFDGIASSPTCKHALLSRGCKGTNSKSSSKYFELFKTWPPR